MFASDNIDFNITLFLFIRLRILEEKYGIHCNLTLLFSFAQVKSCNHKRACMVVLVQGYCLYIYRPLLVPRQEWPSSLRSLDASSIGTWRTRTKRSILPRMTLVRRSVIVGCPFLGAVLYRRLYHREICIYIDLYIMHIYTCACTCMWIHVHVDVHVDTCTCTWCIACKVCRVLAAAPWRDRQNNNRVRT